MSVTAGAALFGLFIIFRSMGLSIGVGAFVFLGGIAAALTGSIMGMMRKGPPQPMQPMGMRPPMYPQQQMYPQPQPMYPQQPTYQQPMNQPPPLGGPCPKCSNTTMWVAQYAKWFCTRCNNYL